ncbi:FAD-binding oxidoreductase [Subtercola sp. YIM 133946]|uniref:FAD-binding oxidoreductase n=1 Tax=Subtercola sp. YIM 133946 TaxID=3118909 RepID=UPI002F95FD88
MTDFAPLHQSIGTALLTPDDAGFADEVRSYNLRWVHTPEAVVAATSADDVAATLTFAAAAGLPVRVLATGHGDEFAITDGIIVSTRHLRGVTVDPEASTATFGAGTPWSEIVAAADEHDLAAITGAAATVGAVGYLLGGGLGPLARSHGMSSDYCVAFTLVTPAGAVVEVDRSSHPELFWALRGGKGGLGIVTRATVRLVALPELFAGNIIFAEEHIEQVLRGWADFTLTAHDHVSTSVAVMRLPPLPELPPFLSGKNVIALRFAYPGNADEGAALLAPLRALAPALVDSVRPMRPIEVPSIHNDPPDPAPAATTGALFGHIDSTFVDALLEQIGPGAGGGAPIPLVAVELRHLGSAVAVDVPEGSAAGGRSATLAMASVAVVIGPALAPAIDAANAALVAALTPWLSPETNINFATSAFRDQAQFTAAWPPETFARLAALRAEFDPAHVLPYGPAAA